LDADAVPHVNPTDSALFDEDDTVVPTPGVPTNVLVASVLVDVSRFNLITAVTTVVERKLTTAS